MSLPAIMAIHPARPQHPPRYRCGKCGLVGTALAFRAGRGRHYGEHPDYSYCSGCGACMPAWEADWRRAADGGES